ncbi:leucine-rich repeat extensin-like protein 4 [Ricinus communis]|uniref:Cell wall hydroxyproline-rich glycoprotein n=1 Tax=Ricinus communis TaxID=3988 RepID=B9RVW8_RICCO|nr:leucine-rich repeat extensin-like protein 4 [Ricinus communis]EEF44405.1 serine-threonine protein kinase, plant-type, putative [Ricinus communis]|eukprot:XP_002517887.1 leucine-rich repeat extensin-like protein 4 [Ricinus communis]
MASFSLNPIPFRSLLILLILNLSCLFNNIAAKHGNSAHHRHHSHIHSSTSNPRLQQAYIAFRAWKRVIYSDPNNFTTNWVGPNVCNYTGVYCASARDDPNIKVVAGLDLNFANLAGFLPDELGLLTDLALIHLNSNRFCGIIPQTITNLTLLYELDLSNNRFVGGFPSVVLSLPMLNYLDIRYNEFEGPLPPELFQKKLDAIFVNNNMFSSVIPAFPSGSTATVVVIANNNFGGCLPPSIANLAETLEELLLININLTGCLPPEVGYLYKLRLLDVSHNKLVGPIPYSLAGLAHLERLNLAHNLMSGDVPEGVCILPNLSNFTFSYNFFCEEEGACMNLTSKGIAFDDRRNCLPEKPLQRSKKECDPVLEHPVDCYEQRCVAGSRSGGMFGGSAPFGPAIVPAASPLMPPSIAPSST